jgi:hypothetical protein
MVPFYLIILLLVALVFNAQAAEDEKAKTVSSSTYRITWEVISSGGEISASSSGGRISSTVGQMGVETLSSAGHNLYSGFWNPSLIGMVTSVEPEAAAELPKSYRLNQNYPNPFNPVTSIQYDLPKASRVTIEIYNTLGHPIRTLIDETKAAGFHTVQWDGRDRFGRQAGNGVFIYRIVARSSEGDSYSKSMKMLLVK